MNKETAKKIFNRSLDAITSKIVNDMDLGGKNRDDYISIIETFKDTMLDVIDSIELGSNVIGQPAPQSYLDQFNQTTIYGYGPALDKTRELKQAATLEAAKKARQGEAEGRMVECRNGPAEGTYVPIAGDMPVGARTVISGCVYQLKSEGLVYDAEATQRFLDGTKTG